MKCTIKFYVAFFDEMPEELLNTEAREFMNEPNSFQTRLVCITVDHKTFDAYLLLVLKVKIGVKFTINRFSTFSFTKLCIF